MAWLQALCVAALCAAVTAVPMTKGYTYPEPENGLYLPPPPDKGVPINPGGSDNNEVRVVPPQNGYLPPSLVPDGSDPTGKIQPPPTTTRRPTTRRPVYTTRRPTTRRPTTRRPVYTTRRPIITTRRPIITTRRPVITTRRPIITTRRPIITTRRPIITTRRPVITTRRPVASTPSPKIAPGMMHMSRPYEFGYDIADDNTDNAFSQKETSDGMVITGEYRWDMPDGRTQIVTYLADWAKGYYPTVRYVPTDSL